AGTAKRGDFRLISVVLNAQSSNQRFEDTVKLLDYGFGHYDSIKVVEKGMVQKTIPVEKGHINEVNVIVTEDVSILIEKGREEHISTKIDVPEKLFAPLNKNQAVGTLTVEQNGKAVKQIDLVISEDVMKAGFLELLKRVFGKWLSF
ncbi:MAG TPA: D-alanyl-D-alanine carboxypeptidase, partial [Tepidanaerobacteraceae bacterium]|nr:D-alanyl-D-alanine carboxypeptidase [Tepidanaerobacteraceae bacterium]